MIVHEAQVLNVCSGNVRVSCANGVTVRTGASTTVVASSVTTTSSFLHFVDRTVAVVVASSIAVTEGFEESR